MRAHRWEHRGGKRIPKPGSTLCASLRNGKAHGSVTRAILWKFTGKMLDPKPARGILCGDLQENRRTRILGSTFCARLRTRNGHGHFTNFYGNLQDKMPHTTLPTSIEHRVLTVTVRTPQCGHTVWGKKIVLCDGWNGRSPNFYPPWVCLG